MTDFVTRFAPSPTGPLHLGHAFAALSAQYAARRAEGRLLLRIEDIDQGRCRPEFDSMILADLAWLGVDWDGPIRRQSEQLATYGAAIADLQAQGLIYRCFQTRRDINIASAPHSPSGVFRGAPLPAEVEAYRLAAGDAYALRLSMTAVRRQRRTLSTLSFLENGLGPNDETGLIVFDLDQVGDVVLARKDAPVAYHLAVVVDDALQGVTDVVRGQDLFSAVPIQRVLQVLLGLPQPKYRHHRLICDSNGQRLAKRNGATSLAAMREAGVDPVDLRRSLGFD